MTATWIFVCTLLLGSLRDIMTSGIQREDHQVTLAARTSAEFRSPGYDQGRYPKNISCSWEITALSAEKIDVVFEDFEVEYHHECIWDRVFLASSSCHSSIHTAGERKLCGRLATNYTFTSTTNVVCVSFLSDYMIEQKGFKAIAIPLSVTSSTSMTEDTSVTSTHIIPTMSGVTSHTLSIHPSSTQSSSSATLGTLTTLISSSASSLTQITPSISSYSSSISQLPSSSSRESDIASSTLTTNDIPSSTPPSLTPGFTSDSFSSRLINGPSVESHTVQMQTTNGQSSLQTSSSYPETTPYSTPSLYGSSSMVSSSQHFHTSSQMTATMPPMLKLTPTHSLSTPISTSATLTTSSSFLSPVILSSSQTLPVDHTAATTPSETSSVTLTPSQIFPVEHTTTVTPSEKIISSQSVVSNTVNPTSNILPTDKPDVTEVVIGDQPEIDLTAGMEVVLSSPQDESGFYPLNQTLSVTLKNTNELLVQISSLEFDIEYHPSCLWDYLRIATTSRPPKRECGVSPLDFNTTDTSITLVFHSDVIIARRGFKLRVLATTDTSSKDGMQSILVTSTLLSTVSISTTSSSHSSLYDSPSTTPAIEEPSSHTLTMLPTTVSSTSTVFTGHPTTQTTTSLQIPQGSITPSSTLNSLQSSQHITSVVGAPTEDSPVSSSVSLPVFTVSPSSISSPSVTSPTVSDASTTTSVGTDELPDQSTTIPVAPKTVIDICASDSVVLGGTITVVSPGFLDQSVYPRGIECYLTVTSPEDTEIVMTVEYFDVESHYRCGWDYLQLHYGNDIRRMCGTLDTNTNHVSCHSGLPHVIDPITQSNVCLQNIGRSYILKGVNHLGLKLFSDHYIPKTGFNITLTEQRMSTGSTAPPSNVPVDQQSENVHNEPSVASTHSHTIYPSITISSSTATLNNGQLTSVNQHTITPTPVQHSSSMSTKVTMSFSQLEPSVTSELPNNSNAPFQPPSDIADTIAPSVGSESETTVSSVTGSVHSTHTSLTFTSPVSQILATPILTTSSLLDKHITQTSTTISEKQTIPTSTSSPDSETQTTQTSTTSSFSETHTTPTSTSSPDSGTQTIQTTTTSLFPETQTTPTPASSPDSETQTTQILTTSLVSETQTTVTPTTSTFSGTSSTPTKTTSSLSDNPTSLTPTTRSVSDTPFTTTANQGTLSVSDTMLPLTSTPSQTTEPVSDTPSGEPNDPTFFPITSPGYKDDVTSACNNGGVPLLIDGDHGYIESPGFSNGASYPSLSECKWQIVEEKEKKVQLIFESFDLEPSQAGECRYDKVTISETRSGTNQHVSNSVYCGQTLPPSLLTSHDVTVEFVSDGSEEHPGFRIIYMKSDVTNPGPVTHCPAGRWLCPSSNVCIPVEWICDGEPNCPNYADENQCDTCSEEDVKCDDGTCLPMKNWCDGQVDCSHGEDERHCVSKSVDTSVMVQIGKHGYPLCYSEEQGYYGNKICNLVGYRLSESLWTTPSTGSGAIMTSHDHSDLDQVTFTTSETCPLMKVLNVQCSGEDCGIKPEVHRRKRVIEGSRSETGQWPWTVALRSGTNVICGASVLNEQWLLTAGHCVEYMSKNPHVVSIVAGVTDVNDVTREIRYVTEIVLHPAYYFIYNADIALLRLNKPLPLNDRIGKICLPWDEREFTAASNCYIAGWGVYDMKHYYTTLEPRHLRHAKTKVVGLAGCRTAYNDKVKDTMICAGYVGGGIDSCKGDSGGGLMCETPSGRWTLAGVISWGEECGNTNKPGVYTRVTSYLNWINDTLPVPDTGSVNCTFETTDWCGYTDLSTDAYFWTRVPGAPGYTAGHHLSAARPSYDAQSHLPANASILSPTFTSASVHCLTFSFMFSVNSNLTLSVYAVPDHHDDDVEEETLLWRVDSNYPPREEWQTTEVTVAAGTARIRFESLFRYDSIYGLVLDTVSVDPGTCAGTRRLSCSFDDHTVCLYGLESVYSNYVPRTGPDNLPGYALQLGGSFSEFGFMDKSQLISPKLPITFASLPHCVKFSFIKVVTSSFDVIVSTYVSNGGQLANQKVYWSSQGSPIGEWSTVQVTVVDTGYFEHVAFEVRRTSYTTTDVIYLLDDVSVVDGQCI